MNIESILRNSPVLFMALFVGILFLQAGIDKAFDWKGNLEFITGHFSKTFLSGMVPMMLGTITLLELATGLLSIVGVVYFLAAGSTLLIFIASLIGAAALTALFFGQRIAKDYPGAAVLVPYFLLDIVLMFVSRPV